MTLRSKTNRVVNLHFAGQMIEIPKGADVHLVEGCVGGKPAWVVTDVKLLARLTNEHDAEHRYAVIPVECVEVMHPEEPPEELDAAQRHQREQEALTGPEDLLWRPNGEPVKDTKGFIHTIEPDDRTEYAFDVKLFATVRVKADTEEEARVYLCAYLDCADCNGGAWANGDPILFEATVDDDSPELIEVDGESV